MRSVRLNGIGQSTSPLQHHAGELARLRRKLLEAHGNVGIDARNDLFHQVEHLRCQVLVVSVSH